MDKGFDGHTSHYTSGGIEVIDIIEAYNLGFSLGNAVKYILRCGKKGTEQDSIKDLEKAKAYLSREIERRNQCIKGE